MSLARRLDRLDGRKRPMPAKPALDFSALTSEELFELDTILAKLEGVPKVASGRANLSPLSDAELDRLTELSARIPAPT